jgi:integrase
MWEGINPFGRDRLIMPRPQNKGERFLLPEEARKLLTELEKRSPQLHDMAWLSLKTGLRSTEIFRLQGADIDLAASVLWITEKGGTRKALCVARDILEKLASYGRRKDEYIFQDRQGGKMTHISDTFERVCVSLGWNPANAKEKAGMDPRKRVWFHTLRHTFASWLAQSGKVTLYELRDLMRHKTINMTERYAHLIPAQTFQKAVVIDEVLFKT